MTAARVVDGCERCGWDLDVNGQCLRAWSTGDPCELYAYSAPVVLAGPAWPAPVAEGPYLGPFVADCVASVAWAVWWRSDRDAPTPRYRKRAPRIRSKVKGWNFDPPMSKLARYIPEHVPTWWVDPAPPVIERSAEWRAWYEAMPAGMTAKQEREYFLKRPE